MSEYYSDSECAGIESCDSDTIYESDCDLWTADSEDEDGDYPEKLRYRTMPLNVLPNEKSCLEPFKIATPEKIAINVDFGFEGLYDREDEVHEFNEGPYTKIELAKLVCGIFQNIYKNHEKYDIHPDGIQDLVLQEIYLIDDFAERYTYELIIEN